MVDDSVVAALHSTVQPAKHGINVHACRVVEAATCARLLRCIPGRIIHAAARRTTERVLYGGH